MTISTVSISTWPLPWGTQTQKTTPLLNFPEQEVVTKDQMRVDSSGNNTKILIMKARRNMTGKYILKAKNEHGEDSVEIAITVLGKWLL